MTLFPKGKFIIYDLRFLIYAYRYYYSLSGTVGIAS